MIPQTPALNRKSWKYLEVKIADEYSKRFGEVFVVCGPIYDGDGEGRWIRGKIRIPTHCYMILSKRNSVNTNDLDVLSFIFPNADKVQGFMEYTNSVDKVEQLTGLDFFSDLDYNVQTNIESKINPIW
jgi:endonuclease G